MTKLSDREIVAEVLENLHADDQPQRKNPSSHRFTPNET